MTARTALAACLAAVALVAPACGGTSKEDYEKRIDEVGPTLDEQSTQILRELQSSGGIEQAAAGLKKGADALDETAEDLDDIEPPDDAEEAHAEIVEGVRMLAGDFRAAERAARSNDTQRVLDLLANVAESEGLKKITEALKELKAAGYDVAA